MAKVTFQDEEGQYLNRYKLTPVEGQANVYDFERMAAITKQGTPYSKEVMDHMLQTEDKGVPGGCAELDANGNLKQMPTAAQVGALPHNPSVIVDPDNMPDGIYYYSGHLEIPANTTGDGEIIQISHDQSFIIQIAYGFHLSGMAVRVKESGTWLAWSKISANKADYASGSVDIGSLGLRNIQASNTQASSYLGLGAINVVI